MIKELMKIDINALISYGLDIESFMVCYCKYYNHDFEKYKIMFGDIPRSKYAFLVSAGFLVQKTDTATYNTTYLVDKRFLNLISIESPDKWIQEWFDLWPRGIRSGGYYVRADINGCYIKLASFMKKNSRFDKNLIMQATKNYLNRSMAEGYEYLKLAPNFIEKNKTSMLAGECEAILDNNTRNIVKLKQGNLFGGNEIK